MTYQQWRELIKRGLFALKSQELKSLNKALKEYLKTWLAIDLRQLEDRLDEWKVAKDTAMGSPAWRTAAPGGALTPFEVLANFVRSEWQRVTLDKNEKIYDMLRDAALVVANNFVRYIPPVYHQTLERTFLKPPTDEVLCYLCYRDNAAWAARINSVGLPAGVTVQQINGYAPTIEPGDDQTNMRGGVATAPANRRVEFTKQATHHTLVHEMLHWVCHEDFRLTVKQYFRTGDRNLVALEGTTEYLARHALKEWDKGGYGNIMEDVITAVNGNQPAVDDLCKAFFQGVNVVSVMNALIQGEAQAKQAKAATINANARNQKIAHVRAIFKPAYANPAQASPAFLSQVQGAFQGGTVAEVTSNLNAQWAALLRGQGVIS